MKTGFYGSNELDINIRINLSFYDFKSPSMSDSHLQRGFPDNQNMKMHFRNYQIVMTDVGGWLAQNNLRWVKPLEKVFCSATFPLLCCLLLLGSLHKRQTKTEASKRKNPGEFFILNSLGSSHGF